MTYCISNYCPGCNEYLSCRCGQIEADLDAYHDASYQAGYEACLADGYDERPGTEWIYRTHYRALWSSTERRVVFEMTEERYGELTWRHRYASAAAYGRWFGRTFGLDLESYVAGFDDAGAGLPSAVTDLERHALWAGALDAYEPLPDAGETMELCHPPSGDRFIGADDGLPF